VGVKPLEVWTESAGPRSESRWTLRIISRPPSSCTGPSTSGNRSSDTPRPAPLIAAEFVDIPVAPVSRRRFASRSCGPRGIAGRQGLPGRRDSLTLMTWFVENDQADLGARLLANSIVVPRRGESTQSLSESPSVRPCVPDVKNCTLVLVAENELRWRHPRQSVLAQGNAVRVVNLQDRNGRPANGGLRPTRREPFQRKWRFHLCRRG